MRGHDSLVALGTGAAWLYSVVATLLPAVLPEAPGMSILNGGRDRHADPAQTLTGSAGQRPHERGDQTSDGLAAQDGLRPAGRERSGSTIPSLNVSAATGSTLGTVISGRHIVLTDLKQDSARHEPGQYPETQRDRYGDRQNHDER